MNKAKETAGGSGMTVKELKEYLDEFNDNTPVGVIGAYEEKDSEARLVYVDVFGVLSSKETEYPILLMQIKDIPEEAQEAAE